LGSQWDQIKSYSGVTAIVSLYGIASLLVVFLGPSLGLGLTEQIIIIALLLLTWPFAMLITHYRRKRRERKESQQTTVGAEATADYTFSKRSRGPSGPRIPSNVQEELTRGVEEVVQWLGSTRVSSPRRGDPANSLPWFLVAGLPASGKSSLLLSSGMDFHALPTQRHADQNLVRPTRDVDWRVTDWCVLLDTTGRYQTEGPDAEEWSALIETIRKYRKRRPIDGLLVTANIEKLLASGEAEVEQQAKVLRARLDDLNVRVQARFPVYLVFTHSDSIEGFEEFFPLSEAMDRGQVWGTTIPLEQVASAHARFDVEFDYLYDTLMRYRLLRLSTQESPTEQLMIFDFPHRFSESRRKLGLFTSALFRPNPFSESPLLRGFYFTSSAAHNGSARAAGEDALEAVAGEGYFSERLFNDVLRRDKDLAASFQAAQESPQRWRNLILGAAMALVLLGIIGLIVSFSNNAALISEGRKRGANVARYAATAKDSSKEQGLTSQQLQEIDKLRETLVTLDDHQRDWPPLFLNSLFYRFGLYSGSRISPYLRAIYFDAISHQFFNPTIAALETDLQSVAPSATTAATGEAAGSAKPSDPQAEQERLGRYYDLLKAYLMLSESFDKAEASFLFDRLKEYWRHPIGQDDQSIALRQLEFYASQASRSDIPHVKKNEDLVQTARVRLEAYPPVSRYYKRATTDISTRVKHITLAEIVEGKKNVLEGTAVVPGIFTVDGYKQMLTAIAEAPKKVSEDDWVVHSKAAKGSDQAADMGKLSSIYSQEYIQAWRNFLKDVKVRNYTAIDDAGSMLKELAKNDSPLLRVMEVVARETNLSKNATSFWSRLNPFSSSKSDAGAGISRTVEEAFQPVIKFAGGDAQKGGDLTQQYLKILTDVRDVLNEASGDDSQQAARKLLSGTDPRSLSKFEGQVKPILEEVKSKTGAGTDAASLLEQPLGNVRRLLVVENRDQIDKEWRDKLYVLAQKLEQGYPFATSPADSSLTDLARFLNPIDGQLWLFFRQNLESSLIDANGRWQLKEGSRIKLSDSFVNYINNARRVTDGLFSQNGKTPSFDFGFALQTPPVSNNSIEVQVEGKGIDSSGTPQNIKWSGSGGASIKVSQGGSLAPPRTWEGWWALFRMFEAGGGAATKASDNRYSLSWKVGSVSVMAKLQPPSTANNPFELSLFRQMRAPQTIQ
jgi:type VI secretion system protein ImpL